MKTITDHKVVSSEEWLEARKAFLKKEKDFTRQRDELSRQRRELPWENRRKAVCLRRSEREGDACRPFRRTQPINRLSFHVRINFDYHVSFTKDEMAKRKVYYNYEMQEFGSEERVQMHEGAVDGVAQERAAPANPPPTLVIVAAKSPAGSFRARSWRSCQSAPRVWQPMLRSELDSGFRSQPQRTCGRCF